MPFPRTRRALVRKDETSPCGGSRGVTMFEERWNASPSSVSVVSADDELWDYLKAERIELAEFLDTLTPSEWNTQSLCGEWRVRDVAAHLAWGPTALKREYLQRFVNSGFRVNRCVAEWAKEDGARPTDAIVARLREVALLRHCPPGVSKFDPLLDILVHNSDIRRPLGNRRPIPAAPFLLVAHRLELMSRMLGARGRTRGLHLVADDIEWTMGSGPEVHAKMESILMVLSGRPVGPDELTGNGAARLYARL